MPQEEFCLVPDPLFTETKEHCRSFVGHSDTCNLGQGAGKGLHPVTQQR